MVEVDPGDILFLKEEYELAQKRMIEYDHEGLERIANFHAGMKRGLEMALVRMGVTNDELDEICMRVRNGN